MGLEGQRGEVRRFRPGLDYTVAHYGILTKDPQLDAGGLGVGRRWLGQGAWPGWRAVQQGRGIVTEGPQLGAGGLGAAGCLWAAAVPCFTRAVMPAAGRLAGQGRCGAACNLPTLLPTRASACPCLLPAVLCFVSAGSEDDRGAWEGGEVGGYEAYLLADDDGEAAEVYKAVRRPAGWDAVAR